VKGRIIDVSRSAALALGMMDNGVIRGRLRVVSKPEAAPAPAFVVQVGAYAVEASAHDLRRRLVDAGFEVDVITASPGADVVYRVRSGRFATRAEADAHAARLERAGYGGLVVSD
jgi:rare lipoprotein A (peptidoglycan hydrolase)